MTVGDRPQSLGLSVLGWGGCVTHAAGVALDREASDSQGPVAALASCISTISEKLDGQMVTACRRDSR